HHARVAARRIVRLATHLAVAEAPIWIPGAGSDPRGWLRETPVSLGTGRVALDRRDDAHVVLSFGIEVLQIVFAASAKSSDAQRAGHARRFYCASHSGRPRSDALPSHAAG